MSDGGINPMNMNDDEIKLFRKARVMRGAFSGFGLAVIYAGILIIMSFILPGWACVLIGGGLWFCAGRVERFVVDKYTVRRR